MIEKIGIIGDVHSEHARLQLALLWLERQAVDVVVCTGDIADGKGCIEQTWRLLHSAGVQTVVGNHDRWLLTDTQRHVAHAQHRAEVSDAGLAFLASLPKVLQLQTLGGELRLCHGVAENDMAKVWPGTEHTAIKRSPELDVWLDEDQPPAFVVNGHMHFRTLIDFNHSYLLNAGTLKGRYAGVSVLDLARREVCGYNVVDDDSIHATQQHNLDERRTRRVWRSTQCFDGAWQPVTLHRQATELRQSA